MSIKFDFSLVAEDSKARAGLLRTAHGDIETPIFMPVGTLGTVKGIFVDDVKNTGAQIILGNTYHLMLRPGSKILEKLIFTSLEGLLVHKNWKLKAAQGCFVIVSIISKYSFTSVSPIFTIPIFKKNGAPGFCSFRKRIWARASDKSVFPNSTGCSLIPNLFQRTMHP